MSEKLFSTEEIEILSKNKYVKKALHILRKDSFIHSDTRGTV